MWPRSRASTAVYMPEEDRGSTFARSMKLLQENLRRSGPNMLAGYTLLASLLLCGGIGFGLDQWLGTEPWMLFGGLVLGIVVGFFELARIMWRK